MGKNRIKLSQCPDPTETLVDYSTQSKGKKPGPNKHEGKYDKTKSFGHKYEGKAKTFQWRHGKMMVYTKVSPPNLLNLAFSVMDLIGLEIIQIERQ